MGRRYACQGTAPRAYLTQCLSKSTFDAQEGLGYKFASIWSLPGTQ
jgi:hypothetical protein